MEGRRIVYGTALQWQAAVTDSKRFLSLKKQTAVAAYFSSKQLPLFAFAGQGSDIKAV